MVVRAVNFNKLQIFTVVLLSITCIVPFVLVNFSRKLNTRSRNVNHRNRKQYTLPNLLFIGTQKGGSTAIAYWMLEQKNSFCGYDCGKDPLPYCCGPKEAHIIDHAFTFKTRLKGYTKGYQHCLKVYTKGYQHCAKEAYILDATPNNILYPERVQNIYEEASSKGENLLNGLKVILSVREPVSRLLSLYNHKTYMFMKKNNTNEWYSRGIIRQDGGLESFDGYVNQVLKHPKSNDLLLGYYAQHLKKWLQFIPRSNLLILQYDELKERPEQTQHRISQFLNINIDGAIKNLNAKEHSSKVQLPLCETRDKLESMFAPHNEAFYELLQEYPERHAAEEWPFPHFTQMECEMEAKVD